MSDPATSQATGGGSPIPPDPGAVALMICLCGLVGACALLAHRLARKHPRHRPVFVYFALLFVGALLQIPQWVGHNLLGWAGPYEGLRRVVFHVSQAGFLVDSVALPWLAWRTLGKEPESEVTAWARSWWLALPVYVALVASAVVAYPELRERALLKGYLLVEMISLFVASIAVGGWLARRGWRRNVAPSVDNALDRVKDAMGPRMREAFGEIAGEPPPRMTIICTLALVAAPLALLLVGAWRYGLYGPAYAVQQAGLLALYGVLVGAQAWALWSGRAGK